MFLMIIVKKESISRPKTFETNFIIITHIYYKIKCKNVTINKEALYEYI